VIDPAVGVVVDGDRSVQTFVEETYEFWFSSEDNLNEFLTDPWKYAPQYGGFCAFGMAEEMEDFDNESNHDLSTGFELSQFQMYCATDYGCPPGTPFAWYIDNDERLYTFYEHGALSLWLPHKETFIAIADRRWAGWWGSLEAGMLNTKFFG
jgi:YHS domain-containing protein